MCNHVCHAASQLRSENQLHPPIKYVQSAKTLHFNIEEIIVLYLWMHIIQ